MVINVSDFPKLNFEFLKNTNARIWKATSFLLEVYTYLKAIVKRYLFLFLIRGY